MHVYVFACTVENIWDDLGRVFGYKATYDN